MVAEDIREITHIFFFFQEIIKKCVILTSAFKYKARRLTWSDAIRDDQEEGEEEEDDVIYI